LAQLPTPTIATRTLPSARRPAPAQVLSGRLPFLLLPFLPFDAIWPVLLGPVVGMSTTAYRKVLRWGALLGEGRGAPGSALPRLTAHVEDALDGGEGREHGNGAECDPEAVERRSGCGEQPEDENHDADLARGEPDAGHAGAGGEAEALCLGPRVADHEGRT